jgi:hypothetical protein
MFFTFPETPGGTPKWQAVEFGGSRSANTGA